MRWPKEFSNGGSGNRYSLKGSNVVVLQWNSGKNKNFMIDVCDNRTAPITIPGKGDEAMVKAIEMAHKLANK